MDENKKRPRKRTGKTLLINGDYDLTKLEGLVSHHKTNSGSCFVVFDDLENAKNAFNNIRNDGIKVKYSYYKIFFRLKDINLTDANYDNLKNSIKSKLLDTYKVNILYFKFYTKNNTLMGSGDLTVDLKESLDTLVSNKDIELEGGTINFYRYRLRKNDDNVQAEAE